jgi:type IV secretion system protein VirD4
MKLTKDLIRKIIGPDVRVTSLLFGEFKVVLPTGSRMVISAKEFKDMRGGADLYDAAVRLAVALGWPNLVTNGARIEEVAHMMLSGQKVGLPVNAGGTKKFFGLVEDPPPALPQPSGVFGSQGLGWAVADLSAARLLGWKYGQGLRIGSCWDNGEPLRYAGEDAENSVLGFGPPGSGKGVAFQCPQILETAGGPGVRGKSSFTVDPSGQLFAVCAGELIRSGVRVLAVMFTKGLPADVVALAKRTRCLNVMDMLYPLDEDFDGDRAEISQLLWPDDNSADRFWALSGRNLTTLLIGCVKIFAHPSEQNLTEVYHKLGDIFNYARDIMQRPNLPRSIETPLRTWFVPGAETNKTLLSVLETAKAELAWLGDEAIQTVVRTSSFSWDELKNSPRPTAVFWLLPVNKLESHKRFLTLGTGAALMGLGKSERGRNQVLLTVDEAALAGKLPLLQRGFAESRKRGCQLSVWYQNIHQAEALFGKAWMNMLSGADIHIYLRPRDLASAEFISAQIGNRSEIVPHFSHSPERSGKTQESVTFNEHNRPVMFPHDVMALPDGAAICIAPGRSKNALQVWARPWFDCPDLKSKGGSDPYHKHRSTKGGHKA